MSICSFCTEDIEQQHDCESSLEARLAVFQNIGDRILSEVEKIGRDKLKIAFPDLFRQLDALNIASGANMGKTFLERYRKADALAQAVATNKDCTQHVIDYVAHVKDNNHSGF